MTQKASIEDTAAHLSSIKIDRGKPKHERVMSFLEQIRYPNLYKNKGYFIEVEYTDGGKTLQENLKSVIGLLMNE